MFYLILNLLSVYKILKQQVSYLISSLPRLVLQYVSYIKYLLDCWPNKILGFYLLP